MLAQEWHKVPPHDGYDRLGTVYEARGENRQPVIWLIRSGSNFSHRVLTEAAQGWFMADRRDQKAGDKVAYYDDHSLNRRAPIRSCA